MNRIKTNEKALYLMTLFLLLGFSNLIYAQDAAEKRDEIFFYGAVTESKLARLNPFASEKRPAFSSESLKFPKTDDSPADKAHKRQTVYVRPNKDERFKKYLKRTFGLGALVGNVGSAAVSQITDEPEEWENNIKGFGRRVASNYGRGFIKETTIYGLDEAFKLDSSFYKSGKTTFKARLKNAVLSTFTARKPDGKRVFGFPRIVGTYTSAIIAREVWYPARYDYKDGIRSGTISLGTSVGVNFLREFF